MGFTGARWGHQGSERQVQVKRGSSMFERGGRQLTKQLHSPTSHPGKLWVLTSTFLRENRRFAPVPEISRELVAPMGLWTPELVLQSLPWLSGTFQCFEGIMTLN